ncbi:protein trachealess-like isoform X2 [Convolutriloba macropyga]
MHPSMGSPGQHPLAIASSSIHGPAVLYNGADGLHPQLQPELLGCAPFMIGTAPPVRKERSRDAARNRRGKENNEFIELARTLPVSVAITSQLDKASIVRLGIAFLRMRHLSALCTPHWTDSVGLLPHVKDSNPSNSPGVFNYSDAIGMHILQAMDGFVMSVYKDGRILYVSETVSVYLGLSQVELTGNHILEYVHEEDHVEVCYAFGLNYSDFHGTTPPNAPSTLPPTNYNALTPTNGAENNNRQLLTTVNNYQRAAGDQSKGSSSNSQGVDEREKGADSKCEDEEKSGGVGGCTVVSARFRSTLTKRGLRVKSTGYKLLSLQGRPRYTSQLEKVSNTHSSGTTIDERSREEDSSPTAMKRNKLDIDSSEPIRESNHVSLNGHNNHNSTSLSDNVHCNDDTHSIASQSPEQANKDSKLDKSRGSRSPAEAAGVCGDCIGGLMGWVVMASSLPCSSGSSEVAIEPFMFVMRLQTDFTVHFCELRAREFSYVKPESITGCSLYDLIHPHDIHTLTQAHQTLLSKQQSETSQFYRIITNNINTPHQNNNILPNSVQPYTWVHSQFSLMAQNTTQTTGAITHNNNNNNNDNTINSSAISTACHNHNNFFTQPVAPAQNNSATLTNNTQHKSQQSKLDLLSLNNNSGRSSSSSANNVNVATNGMIIAVHYVIANSPSMLVTSPLAVNMEGISAA